MKMPEVFYSYDPYTYILIILISSVICVGLLVLIIIQIYSMSSLKSTISNLTDQNDRKISDLNETIKANSIIATKTDDTLKQFVNQRNNQENFLNELKTEITRMLHPKALHHVKIGNDVIDDEIVRSTLGFYLFYILIFVACALTISMNGLDMISSLAISASSIGNIGPGLGVIGPSGNWGSLNDFSKLLAMFCMLLGRLEIFTVIVLFSRTYWKS